MNTDSDQFLTEVEPVRCQLQAWRQTRKHRDRIPESLWQAMAQLARAFGVSRVCQALRIEFLVYDQQGFWLCQKRLSQGRFQWWPKDGAQAAHPLEVHQLQVLLWNGDPSSTKTAPLWRRLAAAA